MTLESSEYGLRLRIFRDFAGGPVVKNLPSNAGDPGSIPGQGTKISHAVGPQSPHTTMKTLHAATKTRRSQINK